MEVAENASSIVAETIRKEGSAEGSDSAGISGQETTEAAAVDAAEPAESEKDLDFARRFNALTRRERQILQMETEAKGKFSKLAEWEKDEALLQDNPTEFLSKRGWSMEKLANLVLNDNKPTTESKVERLERELEELRNDRTKAKEEDKKAQSDKAVRDFKGKITDTIKANEEKYELVNQFDQSEMVYQVIEEHYNKTDEILDIDKAAAEVEKYLEAQLEKASSTKKFKSKFQQHLQEKIEEKQGGETKTALSSGLTNRDVAGTAQPTQVQPYLSDDESKKKAAEFLRQALSAKR